MLRTIRLTLLSALVGTFAPVEGSLPTLEGGCYMDVGECEGTCDEAGWSMLCIRNADENAGWSYTEPRVYGSSALLLFILRIYLTLAVPPTISNSLSGLEASPERSILGGRRGLRSALSIIFC